MHLEWEPLLHLSWIHVVGQVCEWILEASVRCPWVGQNEINEDKSEKFIEIYMQLIPAQKLVFPEWF
jgi:hypothetical protein